MFKAPNQISAEDLVEEADPIPERCFYDDYKDATYLKTASTFMERLIEVVSGVDAIDSNARFRSVMNEIVNFIYYYYFYANNGP